MAKSLTRNQERILELKRMEKSRDPLFTEERQWELDDLEVREKEVKKSKRK